MRIIGGKHKGRKLKTFDGTDIRPTSDRAREALFNIFQYKIAGAAFYDGFCGSGGVGIEALSRGAVVTMTDISDKSIKLATENLNMINERATVIKSDCPTYLKRTDKKFDFIFLDPPYLSDAGETALKMIDERKILNADGYAVLEKDVEVKNEYENLVFLSSRKYGKAYFNIYGVKK